MDILIFFEECVIKNRNCIQSDRILNVQVMLGHIHIRVSNQDLNCSQVNSQRLHLRNISVTAAMRGQHSYENRSQAMRELSRKLGSDNEYMKRRRDEFDVLTGSHRRGQCNRPPLASVEEYHLQFQGIGFDAFTGRIVQLLIDAEDLYPELQTLSWK